MNRDNPSLFMGAKIREATEERLLLKLPRIPSPVWMLLVAVAICWAAPALLLYFKANNATVELTAWPVAVGGGIGLLAWSWSENLALRWSKLAPLRGRVEILRLPDGKFSLTIDGREKAVSDRRGLFYLQHERTIMLVVVIGSYIGSVSYFVEITGGGINFGRSGQWDKARAELVRGSQHLETPWPAESVVPLVQGILRVLDLGPQPDVQRDDGLGFLDTVFWFLKIFGLIGFHVTALIWLDHHGNPLPSLDPVVAGLILGAVLLVPDALVFVHHLRRFFIGPLNRKAKEMMALTAKSSSL